MRISIIGNDGSTLSREPPAALNEHPDLTKKKEHKDGPAVGLAFGEIGTSQRRNREVRLTHRWGKPDSNLRSRTARGGVDASRRAGGDTQEETDELPEEREISCIS